MFTLLITQDVNRNVLIYAQTDPVAMPSSTAPNFKPQ